MNNLHLHCVGRSQAREDTFFNTIDVAVSQYSVTELIINENNTRILISHGCFTSKTIFSIYIITLTGC